MYEDLEPIANLKFGQVVERSASEMNQEVSSKVRELNVRGHGAGSGALVAARLNAALEMSEQVCRALQDIWLQLILQRNLGKIKREDVNFIMTKVQACARGKVAHVAQFLTTAQGPAPQWALEEAQRKMETIESVIARELEIKLREQEAFPSQRVEPDTSFFAFLRAFGGSWLTLMSGPLTVPLVVLAFLVPGLYKPLFAVLAIISGVFASYRVWRSERKRVAGSGQAKWGEE
jgi:hypothetical protein